MARLPDQLFRALVLVFPFLAATAVQPRITGLALVIGNLLPLLGALFFGWSFSEILWLYWAESAIIGAFNVIKMLLAGSFNESGFSPAGLAGTAFLAGFFAVHYGGFMAGHAVFLYVFTLFFAATSGDAAASADFQPETALARLSGDESLLYSQFFWSLAALTVSHGISFYLYYLRGREYLQLNPAELMMKPYSRIVLMHITILAGGVAVFGALLVLPDYGAAAIAGLFVALKIGVDLRAHQKEHAARIADSAPSTPG